MNTNLDQDMGMLRTRIYEEKGLYYTEIYGLVATDRGEYKMSDSYVFKLMRICTELLPSSVYIGMDTFGGPPVPVEGIYDAAKHKFQEVDFCIERFTAFENTVPKLEPGAIFFPRIGHAFWDDMFEFSEGDLDMLVGYERVVFGLQIPGRAEEPKPIPFSESSDWFRDNCEQFDVLMGGGYDYPFTFISNRPYLPREISVALITISSLVNDDPWVREHRDKLVWTDFACMELEENEVSAADGLEKS